MRIYSKDNKVFLRYMQESDIQDYIDWYTIETEWQNWDALWEDDIEDVEAIKQKWTNYYKRVSKKAQNEVRYRLQLCINNKEETHIGSVNSYNIDSNYMFTKKDGLTAIGISIPSIKHRRKGYGFKALEMFITYLQSKGIEDIYTQTWSGNYPMIKLAHKLRFTESNRIKNYRKINNSYYDALTFKYTNTLKN